MIATVLTSVVAVLGTLAGVLATGLIQARLARVSRRELRCEARRSEVLAAVAALVSAVAEHRRSMWLREDLRLSNAHSAYQAARATSHATRAAITAPLVTVSVLVPVLAEVARQAAEATYALRDAADRDALSRLRADALCAADRLVDAAGELFATHHVTAVATSPPPHFL